MKAVLLAAALAGSAAAAASAQDGADTRDLMETFRQLDSRLFDLGFNQCDHTATAALVAEDFEFYHDLGGITLGRDAFIESMRNNICEREDRLRRERIAGSMTVEPLYDQGQLYGAIQSGSHAFYTVNDGADDTLNGYAEFTNLWLLENGEWQVTRALSYRHRGPEE